MALNARSRPARELRHHLGAADRREGRVRPCCEASRCAISGAMTKRPSKQQPKTHSWAVYHIKGTPAKFVGIVDDAPDEKGALPVNAKPAEPLLRPAASPITVERHWAAAAMACFASDSLIGVKSIGPWLSS